MHGHGELGIADVCIADPKYMPALIARFGNDHGELGIAGLSWYTIYVPSGVGLTLCGYDHREDAHAGVCKSFKKF